MRFAISDLIFHATGVKSTGMETDERLLPRYLSLALLCVCTPLLIPLRLTMAGAIVWLIGAVALVSVKNNAFRIRMGILYAVIAVLALSPINTGLQTRHFIALGIPFAGALFGPTIILRLIGDKGAIDWKFWPRKFSFLDVLYTTISFPISWWVFKWYFFNMNPDMPTHWLQPPEYDRAQAVRLIIGINAVGIWDELFFINTVYGCLRSLFPARWANLGQAVIYTSVLNRMAFTGVGPIVVGLFALTQGMMYEKSRCLLYVLTVHVIVDVFLLMAIFHHYYPAMTPAWF
jgi:membrane protease YdiL (CAAX protease family)